MKEYLTREESKFLIKKGIVPESASFISWKQNKTWDDKSINDKEHLALKPFRPAVMGMESFDCQDIFSLSDLLNILPKRIIVSETQYTLNISTLINGKWEVKYTDIENDYNIMFIMIHNELIVSLYKLIISLSEKMNYKF